MNKSQKTNLVNDGRIINSNSSTESNSDDDKCRLATTDLIIDSSNRKSFDESNGYDMNDDDDDDLVLEKTGWLHVKHWLTIQSHQLVELASKNQWKRYWIWLKDSHLQLFHDYLDSHSQLNINTINCLCYPFYEYRSNVFTLTTYTGDMYHFQSSNSSEFNQWIRCIHLNSLKKLNETSLISNIKQFETDLIYENKIFQLAELQLKLTTNNQTRLIISKQIDLLEKNLDIFHINIFRNRCYLSSLNKHESLPNSKVLYSQISSSTKTCLYNLHALTPGAIYALIISRENSFDCQKTMSIDSLEITPTILQTILFDSNPQRKIILPISLTITVGELLKHVTEKLNFTSNDYFLYFHTTSSNKGFRANSNDKLETLKYSSIEICRKITYEIQLNHQLNLSGIEINRQYSTTIPISYVNKGSEGERLGVMKDDEIIMINHCHLKDLDSMQINRYLNQIPITLTLRSSRLTSSKIDNHQKIISELIQTEKSYIQDLECLLKQYIEPLRNHSNISPIDIIESFSKNVKSIYQLQNQIFQNFQSSFSSQNILIAICEIFIKYSHDFKIYSTYCSLHLRLTRLFQTNNSIKDFLNKCNLSQQHSCSFESYLIKPIQRLLKYPLFLEQICQFCEQKQAKEMLFVRKAIKMMNKISRYINSMQELYEEFGQSFEYFIENSKEQIDEIRQLTFSDLCAYGEIQWINMYRFFSKKTSSNFKTFFFVFRTGCFLLVRDESNKKNQDFLSNCPMNKNLFDCFIRFLPMNELEVEFINEKKQIWQLTQKNPNTQMKTYFRFANTDAYTFIQTINHCLFEICSKEKYLSTSRSCYDLLPNENSTDDIFLIGHRQSPSPIWKRRVKSIRKRPLSMPNNKNFK